MTNSTVSRSNNRKHDELRPVTIETDVNIHAEGSALISMGNTKVLCLASFENKVPGFLRDSGKGWVSAEYSMLPRATNTRVRREISKGKYSGRTMEIQRLIGRSLRAVIDFEALGEKSIIVDCDTLQADGGTRTASITGGFVALCLALHKMREEGVIDCIPIKDYVAAVSVAIQDGVALLDVDYKEDSAASTDMNLVMTGSGKFVEIQGTAEGEPFTHEENEALIGLGSKGIKQLIEEQKKALPDSFSF